MKKNNTQLTIVMPFFNRGNLVGEMIESILRNDFHDYELLAIDDGSSPETVSYINSFAEKDSRIQIITRNELPKGAPTCRNIGLREAKGEYIIFFDSDDYITPSCLQKRIDIIKKRPDMDFIVFPSGVYIDGKFITDIPKDIYGCHIHKDDIASFCRRILPFVVVNNIYRTEALRAKNIQWDTSLKSLQDCDFNVKAITAGLKYDYAKVAPDYGYRTEGAGNSVSRGIITKAHYESNLYSINKLYGLIQNHFGHKYDRELYEGALFLFNNIMSRGIDFDFATKLSEIISNRNTFYGFIAKCRFKSTSLLCYLFPPRLARQIVMGTFLIGRLWKERNTKKRIAKYMKTIITK